jgi:hypothetical protein
VSQNTFSSASHVSCYHHGNLVFLKHLTAAVQPRMSETEQRASLWLLELLLSNEPTMNIDCFCTIKSLLSHVNETKGESTLHAICRRTVNLMEPYFEKEKPIDG